MKGPITKSARCMHARAKGQVAHHGVLGLEGEGLQSISLGLLTKEMAPNGGDVFWQEAVRHPARLLWNFCRQHASAIVIAETQRRCCVLPGR